MWRFVGLAFLQMWFMVSYGALSPEQKTLLHGVWKGTMSSTLVGIRTIPKRLPPAPVGSGSGSGSGGGSGASDNSGSGTSTSAPTPPFVYKNNVQDFEPGCLVSASEIEIAVRFDTSTDTFAFHEKELEKVYSGEDAWIPELATTGKIRSWSNGELQLESLHEPSQRRCWAMREVFPGPNTTYHLFIATKNTIDGQLTSTCPDRTTLACDLGKDPPQFVNVGVLYKQSGEVEARINQEHGWTNTLFGENSCQYAGKMPWDLFLPVDCWTRPPEQALPLFMIVAVFGMVVICCCGTCAACCFWCCGIFKNVEREDMPLWLRCLIGICCCCCRTCMEGFNSIVDSDSDDEEARLKVATDKKRVKAHRPDWARKYGDHATAWRVAAKI